jgi:hypothetical protein
MAVTDIWAFGVAPETAEEVAKGSHQTRTSIALQKVLFVTHMKNEKSSMGHSQVQMSDPVKF